MEKFFIVGCPRSGTTMVQQALNRHTRIAIPPETKFFFSFLGHCCRRQVQHVQRLNADLKIHLPEPLAAVSSIEAARWYYDEMARQYVHRLGKKGIVCFGEKTPEHTGRLAHIREVFPEAKIIVLYRDGRDVASSLTRMPWMSSDLYVNFVIWLYYHWVVQNVKNSRWPNLFFVKYEDVVGNPRRVFRDVLDFLELPYEPAVATGYGNPDGIPQREYAWKARALEKITTEARGNLSPGIEPFSDQGPGTPGPVGLACTRIPTAYGWQAAPGAGFLLRLSFNLARFLAHVPWRSVANELLRGLLPRRSSHRSLLASAQAEILDLQLADSGAQSLKSFEPEIRKSGSIYVPAA